MDDDILINGKEVTVNIPFTYTIGEEGYLTKKILQTVADCKAEVLAEIEAGNLSNNDLSLKVKIVTPNYK